MFKYLFYTLSTLYNYTTQKILYYTKAFIYWMLTCVNKKRDNYKFLRNCLRTQHAIYIFASSKGQ